MTITLTIVNVDALPHGASAFYRSTKPGIVIGREQNLDWTLPDPSRHISARHCEIRLEDGGYCLHDHSTNGVFVNGSSERVRSPHRLADGDRLTIGRYIVKVSIPHGATDQTESPWSQPPSPPASDALRSGDPQSPTAGPASATGIGVAPQRGGQADRFLEMFCAGAGIPVDMLAARERDAIAFEIGEFVRLTAERLGELLKARAAAKAMTKSASRTVIGASDNNPLKFVPTAAEAIEAMFSRRRAGYLDAKRSLEDTFSDLRTHELATYAAMQRALARLLDEIAPETIERKASGSAFTSRKTRAWDLFARRWEERSAGENGMLDTFLAYFAEAYDEAATKK